ncbi:MAG: PHP domain-containing protein [Clostridia bacterium]|nr:PHP domain-containing protein [Clostridia bacterium]
MYLRSPTFDLDELFSANYHIHTNLSRCGRKEMTLAAIIKAAEDAHLQEIAITDHIHPYETSKLYRNARVLKPQREALQTDVKAYLGAELSAHGVSKYTLQYSSFQPEYRLYAHNHYHMFGWEQPKDRSPLGYKNHCKAVLENMIRSGKPDCFAHPFIDKYIVREFEDDYGFTYGCITDLWTDNELGDLMEKAKEKEIAWELNTSAFAPYRDFMRRYYHIGKEVGVCFMIGTDAHVLSEVDPNKYKDYFKNNIL